MSAKDLAESHRWVLIRDMQEALQRYGTMTPAELTAALARKDATVFDHMFGHLLAKAIEGDEACLKMIFDRLWGKPNDRTAQERDNHDERLKRIPRAAIIKLLREHK